MSYVGEPFQFDIFQSYSHGKPDGVGVYRLKDWSVAFARELQGELGQCLDGPFTMFLDDSERPNEGLDPLLPLTTQLERVGNAAVLLVLVSPSYLQSKWCEAEKKWWLKGQRAAGFAPDGRVAVVNIMPTDPSSGVIQAHVEDPLGVWFFERTNADARTRPYEWPAPTPSSRDPFRQAVVDLAGRLADRLRAIREQQNARRQAQEFARRLSERQGQVVYLHGREAFTDLWKRARAELRANGLIVMPGEPEPLVPDTRRLQAIRHSRVQTMSACDAVLLVGADDEWAVDADLVVVGRHDRASARAISNRPLPCAMIDSIGLPVATPERKDAARDLNVEWIDATADPWVPLVRDWLGRVAQQEAVQ
jgi:hypothetical protein